MSRYPSLRPLGDSETAGILDNNATIEITEKFDGANMRIIVKATGEIFCGGRNHEVLVPYEGAFEFQGGIGSWVQREAKGLLGVVLNDFSVAYQGKEVALIGEWMQKHTVNYGINKPYPIFYDVYVEGKGLLQHADRQFWLSGLKEAGYTIAEPLYFGPALSGSEIESRFIGKPSVLNANIMAEGIVIKNPAFTNSYGRQCHSKWVNAEFKEKIDLKSSAKRAIDPNNSIDYSELVESLVTKPRLVKLLAKQQVAPSLKEMAWLSKTMVDDVLLEGILDIKNAVNVLNFERFNKQVCMRTVRLLNELMRDSTCITEGVIDGN